jgi:hypothetical protein
MPVLGRKLRLGAITHHDTAQLFSVLRFGIKRPQAKFAT